MFGLPGMQKIPCALGFSFYDPWRRLPSKPSTSGLPHCNTLAVIPFTTVLYFVKFNVGVIVEVFLKVGVVANYVN